MTLEEDIGELFDNAIDVTDTIWYTEHETLFEAIMRLLEE